MSKTKINIYRKCDGNRQTTRNVLDIKKNQIILVKRGMREGDAEKVVSMISFLTRVKLN